MSRDSWNISETDDESAYAASGEDGIDFSALSGCSSVAGGAGSNTDPFNTKRRKRRPRIRGVSAREQTLTGTGSESALKKQNESASAAQAHGLSASAASERYDSSASAGVGGASHLKGKLYCAVCGDEALGFAFFFY